MNKLETAIEIVKAGNGDKKLLLADIQNALGVTRANASVYLFKANKVIETGEPVEVKETKVKAVKVEPTVEFEVSEEDQLAYHESMAERSASGLSVMSIQEWKEMTENLKAFA